MWTLIFKQQSLVLVLAMALALALSAQTEGALTFVNKLPYGLFLYHPLGCCSQFSGWHSPPPGYGCARCPTVYLAPDVPKTMNPIVGPYPLQFLQIMGTYGRTYCVIGQNLQATNTMTIGPKECGRGVEAQIAATGNSTDFVVTFCMMQCIG